MRSLAFGLDTGSTQSRFSRALDQITIYDVAMIIMNVGVVSVLLLVMFGNSSNKAISLQMITEIGLVTNVAVRFTDWLMPVDEQSHAIDAFSECILWLTSLAMVIAL